MGPDFGVTGLWLVYRATRIRAHPTMNGATIGRVVPAPVLLLQASPVYSPFTHGLLRRLTEGLSVGGPRLERRQEGVIAVYRLVIGRLV